MVRVLIRLVFKLIGWPVFFITLSLRPGVNPFLPSVSTVGGNRIKLHENIIFTPIQSFLNQTIFCWFRTLDKILASFGEIAAWQTTTKSINFQSNNVIRLGKLFGAFTFKRSSHNPVPDRSGTSNPRGNLRIHL